MSHRLLWWLATAAAVVGAVLLAEWAPTSEGPIVCLFRRSVELPCPGCGLTRAFGLMARGDLGAALALHPLAPLLALEMLVGWGLLGVAAHGTRLELGRLRIDRWLAATGYLLLAVWMGRLAVGDLTPLG